MTDYRFNQNTPNHTPSNPPAQKNDAFSDLPHTRSSPPLSPTERRVYDLLLKRMTEREVADELERSHNTVHVHVRNIYRKLGVRTRKELFNLPYQTPKAARRNP